MNSLGSQVKAVCSSAQLKVTLCTVYLLSQLSSQNNLKGKLQLIPFLKCSSSKWMQSKFIHASRGSVALGWASLFIPFNEVRLITWPSLSCNEIPPVLLSVMCPLPQGCDLLWACAHLAARCACCLGYCRWHSVYTQPWTFVLASSRGQKAFRHFLKCWQTILLATLQDKSVEKGRFTGQGHWFLGLTRLQLDSWFSPLSAVRWWQFT